MKDLEIRRATRSDLPAITEIYNDAILHTTATFDTQPKTEVEQLAWFEAHDERPPGLTDCLQPTVSGRVNRRVPAQPATVG